MIPATLDASALPPEIARTLRDAFGDAPVEGLSVLKGGRSGATLLSLTVAGKGYVLRRADPARPAHDLRAEREIACIRIASERGIAPRLRHVDAASSVTIMERIDGAPFGRSFAHGSRRIARVAGTLRRLHEGPAFPKGIGPAAAVRHLDESLRARGPHGLPGLLVRTMGELASITERFAESAPCHNDLNPGNILETEERVYFVDWEMACASDPFFDLAELGVFAFPTRDDRAELLDAYLARRPRAEDLARATLARVIALGFYSAAFIHVTVMGGGPASIEAAPLPIPELLTLLSTSRDRASPEVVAASLLEEMRRESETDAYEGAKRALGGRG